MKNDMASARFRWDGGMMSDRAFASTEYNGDLLSLLNLYVGCLSNTCSLTWSEIDWDRRARVIRRMVQREARARCLENGSSKQGSSYKKLQKSPGSASC